MLPLQRRNMPLLFLLWQLPGQQLQMPLLLLLVPLLLLLQVLLNRALLWAGLPWLAVTTLVEKLLVLGLKPGLLHLRWELLCSVLRLLLLQQLLRLLALLVLLSVANALDLLHILEAVGGPLSEFPQLLLRLWGASITEFQCVSQPEGSQLAALHVCVDGRDRGRCQPQAEHAEVPCGQHLQHQVHTVDQLRGVHKTTRSGLQFERRIRQQLHRETRQSAHILSFQPPPSFPTSICPWLGPR
mmetsp:Transcript_30552/g.97269  ORF Transcript_30552/g.97269 Transcript_30552/m.97269 type:complete len:242 (+) Transcript_30552:104-829(+)